MWNIKEMRKTMKRLTRKYLLNADSKDTIKRAGVLLF